MRTRINVSNIITIDKRDSINRNNHLPGYLLQINKLQFIILWGISEMARVAVTNIENKTINFCGQRWVSYNFTSTHGCQILVSSPTVCISKILYWLKSSNITLHNIYNIYSSVTWSLYWHNYLFESL